MPNSREVARYHYDDCIDMETEIVSSYL